MDEGTIASRLSDVDDTVRSFCEQRGLPIPDEIDALVELHIRAVNAWLDEVEAGGGACGAVRNASRRQLPALRAPHHPLGQW
jgi:hypothetical protein